MDQILAQEDLSKTLGDASRTLWPLVDNLGTVRDLAKQDGTIAVHYQYDSYGNVTSGDTSKTRYLFTSREFDTATDLQYNRARWYDAEVGRWISEDPIGFAAGDANVGRYVGNRATGATDPSGLEAPEGDTPANRFTWLAVPADWWRGDTGGPPRYHVIKDLPVLSQGMLPPPPSGVVQQSASTGEYGVGVVPPGLIVGPFGCGPCVGVILIPPGSGLPTYVFHFQPGASVMATFIQAGAVRLTPFGTPHAGGTVPTVRLPGYRAVICGGNHTKLLQRVIDAMRGVGLQIIGYVPASTVHVDTNGNIFYTAPNPVTFPTDEYYRIYPKD